MARLKHKLISTFPSIDKIKDEMVKKFGEDLADIILQSFRNIYDDLNNIQTQLVDDLPLQAQQDKRGGFYIRRGTGGAADELFIVVDTGGSNFGFKKISLT